MPWQEKTVPNFLLKIFSYQNKVCDLVIICFSQELINLFSFWINRRNRPFIFSLIPNALLEDAAQTSSPRVPPMNISLATVY